MLDTYFLGANTPEGFRSEYATLQKDPRIRRLTILKGGPGCGKSTLMKKAAARAEALGLTAERIPCSSDPDSLDGVVLPALGAALADGTAPHVVEPALCGCGANYLDLGRCYRERALLPAAPALRAAKEANAACYVPAYGCLRAAGALEEAVRALAARADLRRTRARFWEEIRAASCADSAWAEDRDAWPGADAAGAEEPGRDAAEPGDGPALRCWLDAFTPQGVRCLTPAFDRTWILEDSFGLGAGLLRRLGAAWREGGTAVWFAMDPLAPDTPTGVLCPARGLACLRSTAVFRRDREGAVLLRLDAAAEAALGEHAAAHLRALLQRQAAIVQQALRFLAEAKERHDELEALYRPAVDFAAADRITETVLDRLFSNS